MRQGARLQAGQGWTWRDTFFAIGSPIMLAFAIMLTMPQAGLPFAWAGVLCWVLIPAVYFIFARTYSDGTPGATICLVIITILTIVAVIAAPPLGFGEAILFTYLWRAVDEIRTSIALSLAIILAIFVGSVLLHGTESTLELAGYALLSYALTVASGVATSRIWHVAEERGVLLAQLEAAQERVRLLSAEQGAAAERERLSRDLHDTLAQTLAGLTMLAERTGRTLERSRRENPGGTAAALDRVNAQLRQISELSRTALAETRALVTDAAPIGDASDVGAALARLAERYEREAGMRVDVRTGRAPRLSRENEVVLLRCAQEALANIRKHADAQHADITMRQADDGWAELEIRDDGRGFDVARAQPGFGLPGLRDRVRLAGGTLAVHSSPGAGTSLIVRLPAPSDQAEREM